MPGPRVGPPSLRRLLPAKELDGECNCEPGCQSNQLGRDISDARPGGGDGLHAVRQVCEGQEAGHRAHRVRQGVQWKKTPERNIIGIEMMFATGAAVFSVFAAPEMARPTITNSAPPTTASTASSNDAATRPSPIVTDWLAVVQTCGHLWVAEAGDRV